MCKRRAVIVVCLGTFVWFAGAQGNAQAPAPPRLAGVINDYSAGAGGPWHVHAEWELRLNGASGKAEFSAAVAMVRSDLRVVLTEANPANTEARSPHTDHIALTRGVVTSLPNGLRVTGTATITGNGDPSLVSAVQIDITGGSVVQYSNVSVTFSSPAASHFGALPLNGVVTRY